MDEIFALIQKERERLQTTLSMIPSENYPSQAVREAVGSILMAKYSEGQAGKRYYQGNGVIDEVERLCKERAIKTFALDDKEWGVNVQALSGSPANLAVLYALLPPGERILSMYLSDGGHLSHGWQYNGKKVTLVSTLWDVAFYHVNSKTEVFDYTEIEKIAKEVRPKIVISGGTAYPREIDHDRMGKIAHQIGAYYMADVAHEAGLIAGKANASPFSNADVVTMTTHKTLRGPRGALIFSRTDLSEKIDRAVFPGIQGGPHNESIAGIAVALKEAQTQKFQRYTNQVVKNAQILAQTLSDGGLHIVSGGTDKHLILVDLRPQKLSGWVVAWAMETARIVANRNTVPSDTASPFYPSGLRLGTPFLTTRGMNEAEMVTIGHYILEIVEICHKWPLPTNKNQRTLAVKKIRQEMITDKRLQAIAVKVLDLCQNFPLPE